MRVRIQGLLRHDGDPAVEVRAQHTVLSRGVIVSPPQNWLAHSTTIGARPDIISDDRSAGGRLRRHWYPLAGSCRPNVGSGRLVAEAIVSPESQAEPER